MEIWQGPESQCAALDKLLRQSLSLFGYLLHIITHCMEHSHSTLKVHHPQNRRGAGRQRKVQESDRTRTYLPISPHARSQTRSRRPRPSPLLTAAHSIHLASYQTSLKKQCASNLGLSPPGGVGGEFIIVWFDEREIY